MHNHKFYIAIFLMFSTTVCISQKENNIWYFGDKAGISFNGPNVNSLTDGVFSHSEGVSSICDASGNLLFFTNGIKVWDTNRQQMPNGFGLFGNNSSSQILIVPKPDDCDIYYIFTTPSQNFTGPLCYSEVDMSLNGGLGDVLSKNTILHTSVTERIAATLHRNGKNYWVVSQSLGSNGFLSYSVTSTGVNASPILSFSGIANSNSNDAIGCMKISSNGNKLSTACEIGHQFSQLFDFDNQTGIVSNGFVVSTTGEYGVEFSEDNSKLYLARYRPLKVTQFDLSNPDSTTIRNSVVQLATHNPNLGELEYGGCLQLGPDKKIYVARAFWEFLDVIENPNALGFSSSYHPNAINLNGNLCFAGLPNLLNKYNLSQCEGLKLTYIHTLGCGNNNNTIFTIATFGASPYLYSIDGTNFQANSSFTGLATGNYIIFVKDANQNLRKAKIGIPSSPALLILKDSISRPVCGKANGIVSISAINGTPPYLYSKNGIDFQTDNHFYNLAESTILFFVKDNNGCIDSINITINNLNNSKIFAGADTGIFINQTLTLHAKDISNNNFNKYTWFPTYGLNDFRAQNPTALIEKDIDYIVTASNQFGCFAIDTIHIEVYTKIGIFVPSAFTPNNDSRNDVLKAIPRGVMQLNYFKIFNRFGNVVFTTKDFTEGWDGKLRGIVQNTDTYIWIAEGIDVKGNIINNKGVVTLIR
jgi:gliding motility-associated-like protein